MDLDVPLVVNQCRKIQVVKSIFSATVLFIPLSEKEMPKLHIHFELNLNRTRKYALSKACQSECFALRP